MMRKFVAILVCIVSLTGCTFNRQFIASTTSLGSQNEKILGVSEGKSSSFYFLFFGPFGDHSLNSAVYDAVEKFDGDTMVNVFVDRQITLYPFVFLPLVTVNQTKVMGTVISYSGTKGNNIPNK